MPKNARSVATASPRPIIGVITGGTDFSGNYVVLNGVAVPEGASLQAAKDAGANVFAWGSFVSAIINFFIIAFRLANGLWVAIASAAGCATSASKSARVPNRARVRSHTSSVEPRAASEARWVMTR